jgi:cell division protein ZapE
MMLSRLPDIMLDAAQEAASTRLDALARALKSYRPGRNAWFGTPNVPRGLYIWGDVGRGKSMLMDLFFDKAPVAHKRRVHFNAFMVETHARIHEWRGLDAKARSRRPEFVREAGDDPIAPVARGLAAQAVLLCFDEFQVSDVADAMILGRLFEQLFERGVVIVATSNIAPKHLYDGGLNRQLFLPFIALIEKRLDIVEINGPRDYRLESMAALDRYVTPLGPEADAAMDRAWNSLTLDAAAQPQTLNVLGRRVPAPRTASDVARFTFDELCAHALAAADYLAIARKFPTILIDRIPVLGPENYNEARRFIILIDTLYDEGVQLVCSAAAAPENLYTSGDGAEVFRRAASRLVEMQSDEYVKRRNGGRT